MAKRYERLYTSVFAFLIVAVVSGGAMLLFGSGGSGHSGEIVIFTPITQPGDVEVHISGAVAHPGIYFLSESDSLEDVLRTAGGITGDTDGAQVGIYVAPRDESLLGEPQKVNVNTAEVWLLRALPGIGPERAGAIVKYRTEKGLFRCTEDLLKVSGIGPSIFDQVRSLVTVIESR